MQAPVAGMASIPEDARPGVQRQAERWLAGEIAKQGHRIVGRLVWKRGTPDLVIGLVRAGAGG